MICMKWNHCGALRGLRLGGAIPDETTILNFRHLLERHGLGEILLQPHQLTSGRPRTAPAPRHSRGFDADRGPPPRPRMSRKARDPEMHQTRKGKNWYFGMKLHIGVDVVSGLVHSLVTTPAHVHDLTPVPELLHGCERLVWGDAGYQGIHKRAGTPGPGRALARRPAAGGVRRTLDPDSPAARVERAKSSLRAKVEHPFRTVKRHFGYDKVRYRGQHKNRQRLALLLGFHNLLRAAPCLAA